jgi:uncharacterized protein YcbK (DUF882 family)
MKIAIITISILTGLYLFFVRPANDDVRDKLKLIKTELKQMGYNPKWFIISGRRDKFLTKISYNNSKKFSYHMVGKAIDIEVIDIDGDWDFDKNDISLIEKANNIVEKNNPKLVGAFGTYRGPNSDWLEWRQVHFDTRGYKKRYNHAF